MMKTSHDGYSLLCLILVLENRILLAANETRDKDARVPIIASILMHTIDAICN